MITTSNGNRVGRADIRGTDRVFLSSHTVISDDVVLEGDVVLHESVGGAGTFQAGKYVHIGRGTRITPPEVTPGYHAPMRLGNYVVVGEECSVRAASVGNRVHIGRGSTLGNMCIVYDCCVVDAGVVLPEGYVVPPFTRVLGSGEQLEESELGPSWKEVLESGAREQYVL